MQTHTSGIFNTYEEQRGVIFREFINKNGHTLVYVQQAFERKSISNDSTRRADSSDIQSWTNLTAILKKLNNF
jgi:hypothetical protein